MKLYQEQKTDPINVLLIEDNPGDARLIQELLLEVEPSGLFASTYRVTHFAQLPAGLSHLDNSKTDIILLDLWLPGYTKLEAFTKTKAHAPDIPIVLLSGLGDEQLALKAVQAGAQDYLVKDQVGGRLLAKTIHYALERHRANKELAASEARFRLMIEQNVDGMLVLDSQGIIRYANPSAVNIFGRNVEELTGQPFGFPVSLGERQELDIIRPDGRAIVAQMEVTATEWKGQASYLASLRDVTQQKRAQQALQESEAFNRAVLSSLTAHIAVLDNTGKIIAVNEAWEQFARENGDPMLSHTGPGANYFKTCRLATAEDADIAWQSLAGIQAVLQGGQPFFTLEYPCHSPHEKRWFSMRVSPLIDTQNGVVVTHENITERKLAEAARQRQLDELTILHAISVAGTETTSEDELIEQATQALGQSFYPDNFGVSLVDEASGGLRVHPSYRGLKEEFRTHLFPPEHGVAGKVVATGQPRRVADVLNDPDYFEVSPGMRSQLCVPLKANGRVIGVINAESAQADAFNPADERLLFTVAGQLATAIDRRRLFEATQRRVERLEVLNRVSAVLRRVYTRSQILPVILDQLLELLPARGALLATLDPATDGLKIELGRGLAAVSTGQQIPAGKGASEIILTSGQPYVSANVQNDPHIYMPGPVEQVEAAAAGVPLIVNRQAMGVMWVNRKLPFTQEDIQLLTAIADMVANAIHRATLYEDTQRHVRQLVALREIDLAITTSLDLTTTLEVLLEQVRTQLGVDAAAVLLFNPQSGLLEYAAGQGFNTELIKDTRLPLGEGYTGKAMMEPTSVEVADLTAIDDFLRADLVAAEKFITYYGLRLVTRERIEGVLEVFHRAPLSPNAKWRDFLEALASQASIAVENAQLFEETNRLLSQTQEQARQVQQIVDMVPEGMLLLDAKYRVVLANPTAKAYLRRLNDIPTGSPLTHLAGRPLEKLLQPPSDGLAHELEILEPAHQIFELEAQSIETGPESGGWLLVIREITQERDVQQRIQQQERLAAVGQLAAGIAHDFNNILTGIIGFAELARFSPNAAQSYEDTLDRIIKQGKRAANLVRQILDFSRQSVAERHPLNLVPLIKELIKFLERTIPEDINLRFNIEPDRNVYTIKGNPGQIQQVITNLVVNARDAMPRGGTIEIQLSALDIKPDDNMPVPDITPGEWVILAVSDDGIGITPEILPRIFEPFVTAKAIGRGTGLGLAQVYGIVKQHGGEIDVTSQVGRGATFTIYLPASSVPEKESSKSIKEDVPLGHGELILLVEDDPAVRSITQKMLVTLGYKVVTATNGQEALTLYDEMQGEIDLVLTDVTMPVMSGLVLAQKLQIQASGLAVIAMTGYPTESETQELLSRGIVAWLQKPLNVKTLAQTVWQALSSTSTPTMSN